MARRRDNSEGPMVRPSGSPGGWLQWLTLAGLAAVLFFGIQTWNDTRKLQTSLNERLGQVDTRLVQIAAKVDQSARPAQAQRGPDPNKVYTVKTDTAPAEGPKNAPVVIAEFSDFQ